MGRHSRKGSKATRPDAAAAAPGGERAAPRPAPGTGRRRRTGPAPTGDGRSPFSPDAPQVRGGHPEQREPGGGWGTGPQPRHGDGYGSPGAQPRPGDGSPTGGGSHGLPYPPHQHPAPNRRPGAVPYASGPHGPVAHQEAAARQQAVARQVSAQRAAQRAADGRVAQQPAAGPPVPGPRREFVDAFDEESPDSGVATSSAADGADGDAGEPDEHRAPRGGKGRTFTGIAAAAVTTVLAVVVAGQVAEDSGDRSSAARAADVERQSGSGEASRSDPRPTPRQPSAKPEVKPLSYADRMAKPYPLDPDLKASGTFQAVPGLAKAPGKGHKYRYRIDVEKGLSLDAGLFAEAVQKTLNDDRSWAHNGAMTFERISSGHPDFVITLASPGTTGEWCAKSGLDTTVDNVSCDSAATDRIMINAYRWARGAATFGPDKLLPYRQMLINHEVGHRLGHNHVSCRTPGAPAPVMQQQTKTLELGGIKCKPNPWVYPGS
ncbi:DUF3152 domain-containing protein [Streptomyces sp. C11-1]|uniref:DUF3152 domain-containing protein n=1 Tax=Streptomyces durocortorensis TaxID=2811104 RepID=A0ABY9W078_9ACTN|nr:DUF3152 domain-containing protein [Streptomyces durocortorensis]WNF29433.1 DUF3152 domain-containing protein [Streptomyces durocortorensis]